MERLALLIGIVANFEFQLDYIIVSGDLTSHADWAYTNVTHAAIIRNVSDTIRSYKSSALHY